MDNSPDRHNNHSSDDTNNEDTSDSIPNQRETLMKNSMNLQLSSMDNVDSNRNDKEKIHGYNGNGSMYNDEHKDHEQVLRHNLHTIVSLHNL